MARRPRATTKTHSNSAGSTTLTMVTNGHAGSAEPNGHGDPTVRPVGRAEVMEAVLQSATELFAERGPDAVTVREVAERASVNHALIHRHFGTKEELVRVVLADAIARMGAAAAGLGRARGDLAPMVGAVLAEETAVRLLAWAIIAGYPVEDVWPDHPAIQTVEANLQEQVADSGGTPKVAELRVALAAATAMVLGWIVFHPFLERALELGELDGLDEDTALFQAAQAVVDRAR